MEMKLNKYQEALMKELDKNFDHISQSFRDSFEEWGDYPAYGFEEIKDTNSMIDCFVDIMNEEANEEFKSDREPQDKAAYMKKFYDKYFDSFNRLVNFSIYRKPKISRK